ncbi:MAG: 50S ribosomal protein L18 [Chloroflexi bacterium]|nr:50S ribosomal protein L18 [Chloroflexota bacterium]
MASSAKATRQSARLRRHHSLRRKLAGTSARPRLAVFRSNQHIYAQVIDDDAGRTLAAASDVEEAVRGQAGTKSQRAQQVGQLLAQRAKERGLAAVVFDRGGFAYAGRVRALADAARKEGLVF